MCTVQILRLTDVMRRYDITGVVRPNYPPKNICRKLFSDDDDVSKPRASRVLGVLQAEMDNKNREKWNFDFRTETPLPGRYQWVPVRPGVLPSRTAADCVVMTEVPPQTTSSGKAKDRTRTSPAHKTKRTTTQSKITDFLLQRKRHRTVKSVNDLSCPKLKSRRLDTTTTSTVN